ALDLVVLMALQPQPRVREVVEIALTEAGYRPLTLFATGLPPAPTALVPVASRTFIEELRAANHAVLADELSHAVGQGRRPAPVAPARAQARPEASPPAAALATVEPPMPEPTVHAAAGSPIPNFRAAPPIPPSADDAPDPGWELDELGDEAIAAEL